MADHTDQRWTWADWLVAAVVALCLFARLGAAPLFDVDEGAFSEATREMLANHDYGSTTLNGAPRFDKPILVYWLQAASVSLLGLQPDRVETAFRLPSALCSAVWVGALWLFLRPRLGARTARLAALMLGSCLGVMAIGRAATADALLNTLLCLSMTDLWRVLERPCGGTDGSGIDTQEKQALRRLFIWVGLGLLAKGPVAALIPGAVGLLTAVLTQRLPRLLRAAWYLPGWALLLAIAAPWYAYILHRHGMEFVNGFLLKHNVERYTSSLEGHSGNLLYYLVMGPVLWLPWSGVLPKVLARARADWSHPLGRFMWAWALFVIGFFSMSGTKLPHYLLYGSPPVLAGLAHATVRITHRKQASWVDHASRGLAMTLITLLITLLAFAPVLANNQAQHVSDPLYRSLLAGSLALAPSWLPPAMGALLLAWLLSCAFTRGFAARLGSGGAVWALAVVTLMVPWLGEVLQGPVRDAASAAVLQARAQAMGADNGAGVSSTEPLDPTHATVNATLWNLNLPSFSVYVQAPTPHGEPAPGQMALTRADRMAGAHCPDCQVLFEERGIVLVKRAEQGAHR